MKPILCVLTSNDVTGSNATLTGYWMSELLHPLNAFVNANIPYVLASPLGGEPPLDPRSVDLKDEVNARFMSDKAFLKQLSATHRLESMKPDDFSAIFFAGGHGPLWDLPNNPHVHELVKHIYEKEGIVAAVCHGPCALVNVQLSNHDYLVKGKRMTCFTNDEEKENGTCNVVPFSVQTALSNCHAQFELQPNWSNHVVVDGRLITGQNPQSAADVGNQIVKQLLE